MAIYFLLLLIFLFFALLDINNKISNRNRKSSILILSIPFILFAGLRWQCGFDWDMYYSYFVHDTNLSLKDIFNHEQFEPLFVILYIIFPLFTLFLLAYNIINYIIITKVIHHLSPYPIFSLFIYFSLFYCLCLMGQMRQGLAISVVLLSIYYFPNKKKMFILCGIATMCHLSAIASFLYLLTPTRLFKLKWIILLLICFIAIGFNIQFILPTIIQYLPQMAIAKLNFYAFTYEESESVGIMFLSFKILLFMCFYYSLQKNSNNNFYCYICNVYLIALILYIILSSLSATISGRIDYYFMILEIFIVPYIISKSKGIIRLSYTYMFVLIYIYQYINIITGYKHAFIPYKFILS